MNNEQKLLLEIKTFLASGQTIYDSTFSVCVSEFMPSLLRRKCFNETLRTYYYEDRNFNTLKISDVKKLFFIMPQVRNLNKMVEILMKQACKNLTGIYQVDDDGVFNPANIRLIPGTIIPKAVGSNGLQRLQSVDCGITWEMVESQRKVIREFFERL